MVTILRKGATKKSITTMLTKLTKQTKSKGVNAFHFVGKINLNEDALSIQKSLRDEWK
jgi:hypothetical protein